jgi:hypothetical protein
VIGWRCPIRTLTGLNCPGCGGTRALHMLLRGKPVAAARFNVVVVLLVAVYGGFTARWLKAQRAGVRHPFMTRKESRLINCVLVGFGLVRNAPTIAARRSALVLARARCDAE